MITAAAAAASTAGMNVCTNIPYIRAAWCSTHLFSLAPLLVEFFADFFLLFRCVNSKQRRNHRAQSSSSNGDDNTTVSVLWLIDFVCVFHLLMVATYYCIIVRVIVIRVRIVFYRAFVFYLCASVDSFTCHHHHHPLMTINNDGGHMVDDDHQFSLLF